MEEIIAEHDVKAGELLLMPNLMDIILDEFSKKIEGERETCLAIFLHLMCAYVKNSTSLPNVMVNSESSAGKSYICKHILKIFPDTRYEYRTKISKEAFTYWHNSAKEPEWTWDGKICYLEDVRDDIVDSDTFKVMASEGSKATIIIDHKPVDIEIKGKPIIIVTTAEAQPKAEVLNRFSIISLDESPAQTKRIMTKIANDAMSGNHEEYNLIVTDAISRLFRLDVRLPDWVGKVIPFFPDSVIRMRRDISRFFDLMKASAVLHQMQRETVDVVGGIWANEQDYEYARIAIAKVGMSGGIFGLTHRQKKCHESCKKYFMENEKNFGIKDMYTYFPCISEWSWNKMLEKLASLDLLGSTLEKNEVTGRPRIVYFVKTSNNVFLPESNTINTSNTTEK